MEAEAALKSTAFASLVIRILTSCEYTIHFVLGGQRAFRLGHQNCMFMTRFFSPRGFVPIKYMFALTMDKINASHALIIQ